jgi:hypothetical protein
VYVGEVEWFRCFMPCMDVLPVSLLVYCPEKLSRSEIFCLGGLNGPSNSKMAWGNPTEGKTNHLLAHNRMV